MRVVAHLEDVLDHVVPRSAPPKEAHNAHLCQVGRDLLLLRPHQLMGALGAPEQHAVYDLTEHAQRVSLGDWRARRTAQRPNVVVVWASAAAHLLLLFLPLLHGKYLADPFPAKVRVVLAFAWHFNFSNGGVVVIVQKKINPDLLHRGLERCSPISNLGGKGLSHTRQRNYKGCRRAT